MLEIEKKEQSDVRASRIKIPSKLMDLKVEKPTVEYLEKVKQLENIKQPKPLEDNSIKALFDARQWNYDLGPEIIEGGINRKALSAGSYDVLIWTHTADPYLPYLFGSLDLRSMVQSIGNIPIRYDTAAWTNGLFYIKKSLKQLYKAIKYRSPDPVIIHKQYITNWKEKCTNPKIIGNYNYYYEYYKDIYTYKGPASIPVSYRPTCKAINPIIHLNHYYTIEDETFMFINVTQNKQKIKPFSLIDVTPLLYGKYCNNNRFWPEGLKKLLFPMHLVEDSTLDIPLFNWMLINRPQKNRYLNYYQLKEVHYNDFLKPLISNIKSDTTVFTPWGTIGKEPFDFDKEPSIILSEEAARKAALEDWEMYE